MNISFLAPFYTHGEIRQKVEEFRAKFSCCNTIPVNIDELIEIELFFGYVKST